jgi:hypothetical protein
MPLPSNSASGEHATTISKIRLIAQSAVAIPPCHPHPGVNASRNAALAWKVLKLTTL